MIDLTGKTALITGASRGIGAATAERLAACGANVALLARSEIQTKVVAERIGSKAMAIGGDVAVYADVQRAFKAVADHFGSVNIVVNNAGLIDPIARLEDSDPDSWGQVVDVNIKGVYHCLHAAHPYMKDSGGVIINLSSGAAVNALEGWSHYCATKAAVLSLTRCAHLEWAGNGIRVVGLSPGTVATDMQEQIRESGINGVSKMQWSDHIPASDVAQAIAWLTQDEATQYDGRDFSLKTPEGRQEAGLSPKLTGFPS